MIKYYVNEDKRTVVAKMEYDDSIEMKRDVVKYATGAITRWMYSQGFCEYKYSIDDFFTSLIWTIADKYFSTPILGKAKCSEEEEFDEEFGKELARTRCLEQYYFRLAMCCEDAYNVISEVLNVLADRHDAAVDSTNMWCDKENDMIDGLMTEEV